MNLVYPKMSKATNIKNVNVPKIIHQTWKSENYPKHFLPFVKSWIKYHPEWEYRLWTDTMNRDFIKEKYPFFLEVFDSYPFNIQRVDAIRYFILYHYGGLYVDLDSEAFCEVDSYLMGDEDCFLIKESDQQSDLHDMNFIISNAFMACPPKSQFFWEIILDLVSYKSHAKDINTLVLETTGPFMLTRVYNEYHRKHCVKLLDNGIIFPLSAEEAELVLTTKEISYEIRKKMDNACAVHYYYGTWWRK
ncbi:glycosyltransferase family 32 protein [Sinomicrobium oceani]|uniref:glycosyltransferase family 32 protein n=1 Tax=Sinomicrobium oceani TaxID=1150368 RepID=UPI00227A3C25|nr:glycosyltransferase [Sinomicrobium oceani]